MLLSRELVRAKVLVGDTFAARSGLWDSQRLPSATGWGAEA